MLGRSAAEDVACRVEDPALDVSSDRDLDVPGHHPLEVVENLSDMLGVDLKSGNRVLHDLGPLLKVVELLF